MSGHSKWAQIRRQKGVNDARRGQMFTKVGREIAIAARQGGGDPNANSRLRLAILKAKQINMPMDNIQRAIQRGAGGSEGITLEEITYEGYGPSGVALMVQVATDNRNRTAAELRNIFSRNGGNLGEAGCVAWLFEFKGVVIVDAGKASPEDVALQAIDLGADDFKIDGRLVEIYTLPGDLEPVKEALEKRKYSVTSAELSMVPKSTVPLEEKMAFQTLRLVDKLEQFEDVQDVYTNADISADIMEKFEG